jgi:hypothetical protein
MSPYQLIISQEYFLYKKDPVGVGETYGARRGEILKIKSGGTGTASYTNRQNNFTN